MEHKAFMKPPKKEEEDEGQVPDNTMKTHSTEDEAAMDELEGILCIEDDMNWEDEFSTTQFFEDADIWDCNGDKAIKAESSCGYWDFDDKKASLKLSLNYQEVLEAWSNRGPSNIYMGEVPVMEEEQGICSRRQASVMRYKEKRQSRLFSKKIRYEVRKVNADKRPRIKGRFVKRFGDEGQKGS